MQKKLSNKAINDHLRIDLIGGMSNKNFHITMESKQYVLRIPGIGAEGMVDRLYEEYNSCVASKMGSITPSIRYFNEATGIKVTDFIKGSETLNPATIQRKTIIRQIVVILQKLHTSKRRFANDFNGFREIHRYERLLNDAGGSFYQGYEAVREQVIALENRLNDLGVEVVPCHNDLVAENFILSEDGQLYLIDWEYSGMNDAVWDIAALFLESNFTEDNQDYFLTHYYQGNIPKNVKEKILIYQITMDVLWSVWTIIKETKGDNFGAYGLERFERAKSQLVEYRLKYHYED